MRYLFHPTPPHCSTRPSAVDGPAAGNAVLEALTQRNRLQVLSLGFNPLGTVATAKLIEQSKGNALRELLLENTAVGLEFADPILAPVDDLQYLWELSQRVIRAKKVLLMM